MLASRSLPDQTECSTSTVGGDSNERAVTFGSHTETSLAEPAKIALSAGDRIEHYVIQTRLGAGGMGEVFAARDTRLNRDIALKLIKPARRADDTRSHQLECARLRSEAQALARLSHPNVVQIYEVGRYDDQTFLAMELVDGPTLRAWKSDSLAELLAVYVQAGRGLEAAHQAGLVHRDFKPANVLIGADERVRVVDFGLAVGHRHTHESATTVGDESGELSDTPRSASIAGPGTLPYMAPEQAFLGAGGASADQFSFCVSLFEALYGQRPFPATGVMQLLCKLDTCVVEFPESSRHKVPRWLRALLLRGLSRHPEDRFASMDALLAELTRDRVRAWRRTGLTTLVAGLTTMVVLLGSSQASPGSSLAVLDGVWDDARRDAVAQSFAAVDAPWATGSEAAVLATLDHWSARWISAARESESRGPLSGRAMFSCLEAQRAQARVLVDTMIEGEQALLEGAYAAVDALPEPSRCAGIWTGTTSLQGEGPTHPAELRPYLLELANSAALRGLGHFEPAYASADAVLDDVRERGFVALELAALRQRGLAHFDAGRRPAGFEDLLAARELAVRSGDTRSQAELAVDLAWLSRKLDSAQLRRDRLQLADAHVGALLHGRDSDHADRHARLLGVRVDLARALDRLREGETDTAETLLLAGLEALTALEANDSELAIDHRHALANTYRRAGQLERAETTFLELLEFAESIRGRGHPDNATIWFDAGALAHHRGEIESARARMLRSRDIRQTTLRIDHPDLARSELALASLELGAHDLEAAEHHAQLALEVLDRESVDSDALSNTFRILGLIAARKHDWVAAEHAYQRAREHLGEDPLRRALVEVDLGRALVAQAKYQRGLEFLEAALPALLEQLGEDRCYRLVKAYESRAEAAHALTKPALERASFEHARSCTTDPDTRARLDAALTALD